MRLIILWFQIRAQEAFIQGQIDTLPLLRGEVRNRAYIAHKNAEAELLRLKSEYRRIKRGNGISAAYQ
ncbi:MAG: hypothetical protein ACKO0Z_16340 [Betaproteobacteria bacterium]